MELNLITRVHPLARGARGEAQFLFNLPTREPSGVLTDNTHKNTSPRLPMKEPKSLVWMLWKARKIMVNHRDHGWSGQGVEGEAPFFVCSKHGVQNERICSASQEPSLRPRGDYSPEDTERRTIVHFANLNNFSHFKNGKLLIFFWFIS